MNFFVVTHVRHRRHNGKIYAYGPYVREMNLWFKHIDRAIVVAPIEEAEPDPIDLAYEAKELEFVSVPAFNLTTPTDILKTLLKLPYISWQITRGMIRAEHIHLRCPGNMGLLGSILQIAFPRTPKTAKYAGNWEPDSSQPWSYRLQRWILSNTFLTRNTKVLVYGEWPNQSGNIVSFFTASYPKNEITDFKKPSLEIQNPKSKINLIFVGSLTPNKQPLLSIQAAEKLQGEGYDVCLDLFGEGAERQRLEAYIEEKGLEEFVVLHGNRDAETLKLHYQRAHFLIFVSKSEGWPKVVVEAMFWGCIPITSDVSCVNYMIGHGSRGQIAKPYVGEVVDKVKYYMENPDRFRRSSQEAMKWSRQFTLERFEKEIGSLIDGQ